MNTNSITLLINSLGDGGAERICVTLANGLTKRGWHVSLIVLHLNNAKIQSELSPKVRLIVLNRNHTRNALLTLWGSLYKHRPNKILVFNHQLALLLVTIRALTSIQFQIIARNISTLSEKKAQENSLWHKYIVHGLTKLCYRKVDRIIAQSQGMSDDLVSYYGVQRSKITIIHNPLNPAIENYKNQISCRKEDYLLCVGRLDSVKGFNFAIEAFAAISAKHPSLRLKIVGKGALEQHLKLQAHMLKISHRVDFEGYQPDVFPYYLLAKGTLLTSLYEGFPNVLVESIALGTPVVAFDCKSGPREIIQPGVNGYLAKHLSTIDLQIKLEAVLTKNWDSGIIKETASPYQTDKIIERYLDVLH